MLSLEQLKNNAVLPTEEFQKIRDGIITAVREKLVGRQFMDILQVPATVQEYGYDRMKTEMAAATVIGKGGDFPRDIYDTERIKVPILKLGDGFTIPREDYLAGVFKTNSVDQMTRRMAEKEDNLIILGDTTFLSAGGMLNVAGNTATDGITSGWGDATNGTPSAIYNEVRKALATMEVDKFTGPYVMIIGKDHFSDLRKFDTTSQRTAMELLTGDPGLVSTLVMSYALDNDTVLYMQTGSDIAQLIVAEDLTVEEPNYVYRQQRWEGNVYERLYPLFYQYGTVAGKTDAVCKHTGINA